MSFVWTILIVSIVLSSLPSSLSSDVIPFRIQFDRNSFTYLKDRVNVTRWPDELGSSYAVQRNDWKYGIPLNVIQSLAQYLTDKFDWEATIEKLNEMPQYKVRIDNYDVHFVHKRSKNPDARALMVIHGWPGSFWECHKILPMLTEPENYGGSPSDAFHVVCPSIPGYGYSSRPTTDGFDQQAAAELFAQLMEVLGYKQYFLQGGDWGSVVASLQASLPESQNCVMGLHLNMLPVPPPLNKGIVTLLRLAFSAIVPWWFYTPSERVGIVNTPLHILDHSGYFHEQTTRPQTLAYGLTDSPVGLLAWIAEKFHAWSDCDGDLFSVFSMDDLLTNFMIYWSTDTSASSIRFYYEFIRGSYGAFERLSKLEVKVPTAMSVFPKEIFTPVKFWAEQYYSDLRQWTVMPRGGHFAALEQPELLVRDIWSFKRIVESSTPHHSDSSHSRSEEM
mmetsp:Transcript_10606/g.16070  ORF Transcript_10606/g.16070 Transcript_10606/m.16070 type:complete len:447 (+) Transcript_10606:56-1396(+)|eukprot:CAMPEP_0185031978 /NCGR_PEP_ID=MMETSP1103-20130426/19784_1 /TAXON_ID=36769 /ORGANISM="Paraphysomonas bandaiensis, Strain Caron Lab Isolate" /LENGTH=446 /DNA_ID=CAMNT_0027567703 /DNA_START=1 /DNA_END=1341 /DNA_ORIENTATION=+